MSRTQAALKRVFLGRPMSTGELEHTLLPKSIALPVFASDALSSMSYATQEVLLVLSVAGVGALGLVQPIAVAVAVLLAIVIVSYRQIVRAYPGGGGAYVVARENLGLYPGLVVAAALLVDYVLTVAVSITAGVDATVSAVQGLVPHKVELAIVFIGLVALANLRGSKESGTFFAIPTYGFVLTIYVLILTGVVRCIDGCPLAETADQELHIESGLTLFLVLKAFAAGTTALTGVEAIAEGVPVFRYPQSRNAATTLAILGFFSISMFLGLSWLTDQTQVVFTEESHRTVVAQVGPTVFGGGALFYLLQATTALILILAANTAYTGFPVLASILARDGIMPRQFRNRGDRLVFSNGIIILTVSAAVLVYIFNANLNRLIQLYLVGVFLSFTLAQWGTIERWRRLKEGRWRRSAAINAIGAVTTGLVLVIVATTKFIAGAWMVVVAIPLLMLLMRAIYGHYREQTRQLNEESRRPVDRRPGNQHVVIYVDRVDAATARAVGYARSVRPAEMAAVTFDRANFGAWNRLAPEISISRLERKGGRASSLLRHLRARRAELSRDDFLTVIVPELLTSRSLLREVLGRPGLQRLKARLVREPGIQVLNVPVLTQELEPNVDQAHEPARNYVVVLIGRVHNATLLALEYAETLRPTDLRAVSFGLDPEETEQLGDRWLDAEIPHPLEIDASPFRDLGSSLLAYVRQFRADGINRAVTVVIPEFVVEKRLHALLHGQTALIVKRHLLFEPGVVVVSVPYELET